LLLFIFLKQCTHFETPCILPYFVFKYFPFTLDDPTLETIRKERRAMSQKCEADTSHILLYPTWRATLKADEEFGEIQI
jgi:hypothetical protein